MHLRESSFKLASMVWNSISNRSTIHCERWHKTTSNSLGFPAASIGRSISQQQKLWHNLTPENISNPHKVLNYITGIENKFDDINLLSAFAELSSCRWSGKCIELGENCESVLGNVKNRKSTAEHNFHIMWPELLNLKAWSTGVL